MRACAMRAASQRCAASMLCSTATALRRANVPVYATTMTTVLHVSRRAHGHAHSHGHGHGIEADVVGGQLRQCKVATLTGAVANVFFSVSKVWLGSTGGSVALLADGVHALTDLVADAISYTTLTLSRKKLPRCHYPFGIGRLETAGTVLVSAILFAGGVALLVQSLRRCVRDAVGYVTARTSDTPHSHHLHDNKDDDDGKKDAATATVAAHEHSHSHEHGHSHFTLTRYNDVSGQQVVLWSMVLLAASSVVCKEVLFRWTRRVGLRAGSRVVVANAYHHRADAWSGAVALVGVAAQCAGVPGVDGVAGLVVSLSICKIGYQLFRDSVFEFFDYQDAVEVARVRDRLQLFHVHVDDAVPVAVAAGSGDTGGHVDGHHSDGGVVCSSSAAGTRSTSSCADAAVQPVRFINVFLTRHGHSYALHVTLLVRASLTAEQIEAACEQLTRLARKSVDVADTFITLLVCRDAVVARRAYVAAHAHTHAHKHDDDDVVLAAMGEVVNPSLERCLAALTAMHHFQTPIRYDWQQRVLLAADAGSDDCMKDMESIAHVFGCRVRILQQEQDSEDDDAGTDDAAD